MLLTIAGPGESLGQGSHHLLVAGRGEQGHGQHVVDDQMGREHPVALLTPTGDLDDLIHQTPGERRRQHAERHPIGQPLTLADTYLSRPWHGPENTTSVTLSLSLIHISEPTRLGMISYAVF